jgi:hypothetical protein
MRYVLLIHVDEALYPQLGEDEQNARMAGYWRFGEQHKEQIGGGNALLDVSTATSVRVRDGKVLTTDGPFAETKEQLNGFYLITAENLDEAVAIASRIPDASRGTIEVRPVMEFE